MTSHYPTWHHIIPHDITWHHMVSRHHMIPHDITWHHMIPHDITWSHMTSHLTWHHMISHDITWSHMTSHDLLFLSQRKNLTIVHTEGGVGFCPYRQSPVTSALWTSKQCIARTVHNERIPQIPHKNMRSRWYLNQTHSDHFSQMPCTPALRARRHAMCTQVFLGGLFQIQLILTLPTLYWTLIRVDSQRIPSWFLHKWIMTIHSVKMSVWLWLVGKKNYMYATTCTCTHWNFFIAKRRP